MPRKAGGHLGTMDPRYGHYPVKKYRLCGCRGWLGKISGTKDLKYVYYPVKKYRLCGCHGRLERILGTKCLLVWKLIMSCYRNWKNCYSVPDTNNTSMMKTCTIWASSVYDIDFEHLHKNGKRAPLYAGFTSFSTESSSTIYFPHRYIIKIDSLGRQYRFLHMHGIKRTQSAVAGPPQKP